MRTKKRAFQGEIWIGTLSGQDSEQQNSRPLLIISNDHINATSPNVICLPITSQKKKTQPFHYKLFKKFYDFFTCETNTVLCECVAHISYARLDRKIGQISQEDFDKIMSKFKYVWVEL